MPLLWHQVEDYIMERQKDRKPVCGDGHRTRWKYYIPTRSRNIDMTKKSSCCHWQKWKKVKTDSKLLPWTKAQKSTFIDINQAADEISWPVSCWYCKNTDFLTAVCPTWADVMSCRSGLQNRAPAGHTGGRSPLWSGYRLPSNPLVITV